MIKLPNNKFIISHPWFFRVGRPERRLLHEYFYILDIQRLNFFLTDPLDIRNFVVTHTEHTSDLVVHKQKEYWPQTTEDVYNILQNKREDCDGLAILTASLLDSIGSSRVQLALGYYGDPKKAYYANHAYCLLANPDNPEDPYLLETTGIYVKKKLQLMSEFPKHNTLISCNSQGEYWIHGYVEKKYRETHN